LENEGGKNERKKAWEDYLKFYDNCKKYLINNGDDGREREECRKLDLPLLNLDTEISMFLFKGSKDQTKPIVLL